MANIDHELKVMTHFLSQNVTMSYFFDVIMLLQQQFEQLGNLVRQENGLM